MKKILLSLFIVLFYLPGKAQLKTVNYYLCVWGPEFKLEVPNVFTPNNDYVNDLFAPEVNNELCIESYHLVIYNRWGQQLFESFVYSVGWNGNNLYGQPHPDGTYCYSLTYKISQPADDKLKTVNHKGFFLLSR